MNTLISTQLRCCFCEALTCKASAKDGHDFAASNDSNYYHRGQSLDKPFPVAKMFSGPEVVVKQGSPLSTVLHKAGTRSVWP